MPWGSVSDRVIGVAKDIYILAPISLLAGQKLLTELAKKHPLIVTEAVTYNLLPSAVAMVTRVWSRNARVRIATNNGVLFGFSALALFRSPLCCLDRSLDVVRAALALGLFAAPVTGRPRMDQCIDGG